MEKGKIRKILSFVSILLLLYLLFKLGVPVIYLPIIGIVLLLLVLFKVAFYKKINKFIANRFPFVGHLPSWGKTLLTIIIFLLLYTLIKQIIFAILKIFGVDVQQALQQATKP